MRFTFFLIRHGLTSLNKKGAYLGCRTDISLSDEGKNEIEELHIKLFNDYRVTPRVYSSSLKRCVESANILFPESKVNTVYDFREIDFGDYEGLTYEDLKEDPYYNSWIESGGVLPFPAGECMDDFRNRSYAAFETILEELEKEFEKEFEKKIEKKVVKEFIKAECNSDFTCKDTAVALVVHGGTIMSIMSKLTNRNYFDFQVSNGNGYTVTFDYDGGMISDLSYCSLSGGLCN